MAALIPKRVVRLPGEHHWAGDMLTDAGMCICGHYSTDHAIEWVEERTLTSVAVTSHIGSITCTHEGCDEWYDGVDNSPYTS